MAAPRRHGIESTIVDFTGDDPVVLRPGSITSEALAEVLGTHAQFSRPGNTRARHACSALRAADPSEAFAAQRLAGGARRG